MRQWFQTARGGQTKTVDIITATIQHIDPASADGNAQWLLAPAVTHGRQLRPVSTQTKGADLVTTGVDRQQSLTIMTDRNAAGRLEVAASAQPTRGKTTRFLHYTVCP